MARKLSFLLITFSLHLHGQDWEFVAQHDLGQKITAFDLGSLNKVFVGTERGNVYSFHADGSQDQDYSSAIFQPVTSLDASNSLRVFVFYKGVSQFEFLERFTAFPRGYHLKDFGLAQADRATTGSSNTIWLLDGYKLTCINPFNHSILFTYDLVVDKEAVLEKLGPDRKKVESMLKSRSDGLEAKGFEKSDYSAELAYLKVKNQDEVTRVEWPIRMFQGVVKVGENFFFLSGEKVKIYRLLK